MAADVVALLDRLELPRVSLVGHSMGGKVAMEVAIVQPECVDRLVVLDIAPRGSSTGVRPVLDALLGIDLGGVRSRDEVDRLLAEKLTDPALRAFLLMGLTRAADAAFQWKFNLAALAENWDAISAALPQRYDGPTLFVRGEESDHLRDGDIAGILEQFPHARIETIPGAGHWLHSQAPDATFEAVRDFVCG
jgi:pimeloyl-ACP methyl ester carboxylesterase